MARIHVCAEPDCPQLEPCPIHSRDRRRQRTGWKHRDGDRAAHARWRYAAIKKQSSCQICGSTDKLDVHHAPDGTPVVLCNTHHVAIDPHARTR